MTSTKFRVLVSAVFLFLFVVFCVRLGLASMNKPFWQDETNGLCQPLLNSYPVMIRGALTEASTSPLFYIANKLWYSSFGYVPHDTMDLRFFGRILHVIYWALACVIVGLYVLARAKTDISWRSETEQKWGSLILAAGIALFYHSNTFVSYYAIEDRAYSLWTSISSVHFLFFLSSLKAPLRGKKWFGYLATSMGLVLTAYSSLAQIAILLFFALLNPENRRKEHIARAGVLFVTCTTIALYYYSLVDKLNYSPNWFTAERYFQSVGEVIAKTFHLHNAVGVLVLLPLLIFFVTYRLRQHREAVAITLVSIVMLVLTFVFFKGSQKKGGLWASRYVIYLVPYLSALYGLGLWWISSRVARLVNVQKFQFKLPAYAVLVAWAAIQTFSITGKHLTTIKKDLSFLSSRNAFAASGKEECKIPLPLGTERFSICDAKGLEALNDYCRGLGPLPPLPRSN